MVPALIVHEKAAVEAGTHSLWGKEVAGVPMCRDPLCASHEESWHYLQYFDSRDSAEGVPFGTAKHSPGGRA